MASTNQVYLNGHSPSAEPTMSITVSYDIACADASNEWEAVGHMLTAASIDARGVQVTYRGIAPHGWPMMDIKFKTEEDARRATAAYMGIFDINDQEVVDYIHGEF
jgi:hypothetical protein